MPVKEFKRYMTICRMAGEQPTWDGLRSFAEKAKKERASNPKA